MPKGTRFSLTDYQTMVDRVESHRKGKTEKGTLTATGAIVASPIEPQKQISTKDVQFVNGVCKINIKPLSVNLAWRGQRFKSKKYTEYENYLKLILPDLEIPSIPIKITYEFGFSNPSADLDNPVKIFTDILQKRYDFDDKDIYELNIKKVIVPKNSEYVLFHIQSIL